MKWSSPLGGCLAVLLLIPVLIFSQPLPSPGEALRVINFYHNGAGQGVVLTESKICHDVFKSGAAKYECKDEVIEFGPLSDDGTPPEIFHRISANETVYIWMSYLVPIGAVETAYLRFNLDGDTQSTSGNLTLKGSIRYRTWARFTPDKTGEWEIEIFHSRETGPQLLGTFILTVQ